MASDIGRTDVLNVLLRRWWVIAVCAIVGVGAALIVLQLVTPMYTATAIQLVKGIPGDDAGSDYTAAQYAEARSKSYPEFIFSAPVREGVRKDMGPEFTDAVLKDRLSASHRAGTALVNITAEGASPEEAQDLANSAAHHLAVFIEDIERVDERSPVLVEIAVQARLPTSSSSPSRGLFLAMGASGGTALGVLLVLALGAVKTRRGEDETDVPASELSVATKESDEYCDW